MHQAFQPAPGPIYRSEKPVRNPLYTRWLKRFACAACSSTRNVDPAHTGPRGLSQKSSDTKCIPLCRQCHDAFDASPRAFAKLHKLNIPKLIKHFNLTWKRRTA